VSNFDKLPRCSFAGVPFPYETIEIIGGVRDHVHEYSHSDGGDPELLGRKLYTVRIVANFHDTFRKYTDLYPASLNVLIWALELSSVGDLVVPQLGTIQAYAVSWNRSISARIRSGEKVTLEFREDRGDHKLNTLVDENPLEIQSTTLKLDARVKEAGVVGDSLSAAQEDRALPQGDRDFFDGIQDLAKSVFAIQDTAALNGQLYGVKLLQLASLCERADGLRSMQSSSTQPIVQALHELWAAALRLADNVQGKQKALQRYTTPQTMTMMEVAIALYHDASRTEELLALNTGNFTEGLAIPALTELVYYPAA
jgi:prophage DNA circulation protein